jgi:uncharacterized membrane protein YdbT with pleckstrin-like domain
MKYLDQSMGKNEVLVYETHFSPIYYAAAWVCAIFFLVLAIWSVAYTEGPADWALLSICVAGWTVVAGLMIPIWTTKIAVTTHRLVIKRGLLFRSAIEIQLRSIEQVTFHQGLLGKLLGFGRVAIHGTGVDDLRLPYIGHPTDLVKALANASMPLAPEEQALSKAPAA